MERSRQQLLKQNQTLTKVQRDIQLLREGGDGDGSLSTLGLHQLSAKVMSSRLGVAVGLESESDRSARISKQIDGLHVEERSLSAAITAALASEKTYKESLRDDVHLSLVAVQEMVTQEVAYLKSVLTTLVNWNLSAMEPFELALADIKAGLVDVDQEKDLNYFAESIKRSSLFDSQSEHLISLASIEFEPLHSALIEEAIKKGDIALDGSIAVLSDGEEEEEDLGRADCESPTAESMRSPKPHSVSPTPLEKAADARPADNRRGSREIVEQPKPAMPSDIQIESSYELFVFGLSPMDKVLETFNCALYPSSSGLMSQGRMFITQHYMAFAGFGGMGAWDGVRILLALKDIVKIEKAFTMGIFPTALLITDSSDDDYFFGSFLDRDSCYSMLSNISQAEKQLAKMDGVAVEKRNLVLGYQTERPDKTNSKSSLLQQVKETVRTPTKAAQLSQSQEIISVEPITSDHSTAQIPGEEDSAEVINIPDFFQQHGINILLAETISHDMISVYNTCWRHAKGYGDFLVGEGDVGLNYDEWVAGDATPLEDVTGLTYSYTRNFVFEHPRTTMLFIGPKNAPAKQIQHLYCGGRKVDLDGWKPKQLINTMVSKFQGFPFADTFKVVMYWGITDAGGGKTTIHLGVKLHWITQTIFRGQIIAGTESEISKTAKRYVTYCIERLGAKSSAPRVVNLEETRVEPGRGSMQSDTSAVDNSITANNYSMTKPALIFMCVCLAGLWYIQWRVNRGISARIDDMHMKLDRILNRLEAI